ncbi:MAG: class I SAM-dependent methyltransferase, partial [Elusimicrobia bacterium]|nr:class I SAM-dependent methyltransferase [Elusimicrobiota bacterium]
TAYRWRVGSWVLGLSAPGRALEVGCGPGIMLNALRSRGWKVKGLERSAAAGYARETLGLDVSADDVSALPPEPAYDLILLFQVLEHLADPAAVLKECASRLKAGGRLIVSVPDWGGWQAAYGGSLWVHLDPPRHLVHFTRRALRMVLEGAGLRVVSESGACFESDVYGWVQTAANRVTGNYNGLTRWLMGIEPFGGGVAASIAAGALTAPSGLLLALLGRALGRGAFLEASATRP